MTLLSVFIWLGATIDPLRRRLKHPSAFFALICALVVQGCAAPRVVNGAAMPPIAADCSVLWATWVAVRDASKRTSPWGVRNAAVPLLRGSRVLAASPAEETAGRRAWLAQALNMGMTGVDAEWANLPADKRSQLPAGLPSRLAACGERWADVVAADPAAFTAVRRALRPADNYNTWARVLGAYPLAVPFMRLGIGAWQRQATQRLESAWAPRDARSYRAGPPPQALLAPLRKSAQLLPGVRPPEDAHLLALLERHAPQFVVSSSSPADHPGAIRADEAGSVSVDATQPTIYAQLGSSYVLGAPRLQLIYTIWFPERAADGWLDPYAGKLDGVIWRVTLGDDDTVLLYDSIHPCGCFHMLFPVVDVELAADNGHEQPVISRAVAGQREAGVVVGLTAGDHQIAHVSARPAAPGAQLSSLLHWRPATELLAIPGPGEQHVSLYDRDGMVAGSERLERFYLWPSGVPNAGAMRVWGQHATAFVGRAHFDDPYLLDRWLRPVNNP
ncbi:hypothetical protein GYB61_07495 [bacterium]|nr:hypothetical protein [bacterium]